MLEPRGLEVIAAVTPYSTPHVDTLSYLPEAILGGAAVLIVLLRSVLRRSPSVFGVSVGVAFAGLGGSAGALLAQWHRVDVDGPYATFNAMVAIDGFRVFLGAVVLGATLAALLLSVAYLRREGLEAPEYLALMLLSATGMLAMTAANDLVVVFVALEVLSIPLYVLAAFDRRRLTSQEAGLKYFLLGAFSSAVFLYGVAMVYGATGTTRLVGNADAGVASIAGFLARNTLLDQGTLFVGIALLLVGLGFKVAAVPFHMWTPDAYEGAPTPITAFMASATKAAGFAAILRVLLSGLATYRLDWRPPVIALAALSLLVGSIAALVQNDIKRMLAYSSIAHAGYILIGLAAATPRGRSASLFYVLAYAAMTIGAFAVVTVISRRGDDRHSLDDYRGLAGRQPALAGLLAFFLLAQAGVPFTAGFTAKLNVFAAAAGARQYFILLVGVLAAAIAAYFYLRVVVLMYMTEGDEGGVVRRVRIDAASVLVLVLAVTFTIELGVIPSAYLDWARHATLLFS
ncbi:MAG: NADH-quinone oxidoreductase subunit N [Acidimicrobiia bacterium]